LLESATGDDASGKPGEVLDDCLSIACATGYVRPLKVQRAGRGVMTPGELLRGVSIPRKTMLS
jgi:methionyl-tRNA formyltransferase